MADGDLCERRGRRRPSARRRSPAPRGSSARQRPSSRRVSGAASAASGSPSRAGRVVLEQRLGPAGRPRLRDVLAGVDDEAMQPGRELRLARGTGRIRTTSFASDSWAASRASSGSRSRWSASLSTRGACRSQRAASAARRRPWPASRGSGRRAGRRRAASVRAGQVTHGRSTAAAQAGLHGGPTLDGDGARARDRPAAAARELRARRTSTRPRRPRPSGWLRPTPRTARLHSPSTRPPAAAGSAASGSTSPGAGSRSRSCCSPPPPVARWPELTLVAAEAVAGAIGPRRTIKHPNDVLVGGRKVAGILAEAADRVVLGIGVNVGASAVAGGRLRRARPTRAARRDPRPARAGYSAGAPRQTPSRLCGFASPAVH